MDSPLISVREKMAFNAVILGRLFRPSALHTTGIERISDTGHINVRFVRTGKKGKLF
jgi:hypothetical protein